MREKKHNAFLVATLALALLFSGSAMAQITKKADAQLAKGEYAKALQLYSKCLESKKQPNTSTLSEIYSKMAKCYMELHYYKPAQRCFEKVMLLNPNYTDNLPLYAEILRCNGQYVDAMTYYYKYNSTVDDASTFQKLYSALSYPIGNSCENAFVNISGQYAVNTFGKKRGLQFFGNKLYYSTTGYMIDPLASDYDKHINEYHVFKSDVKEGVITNTLPENDIPVLYKNKVVSFAFNANDSILFFVAENKPEHFELYCSYPEKGVFSRKKEMRFGGKTYSVESVALDASGTTMIFSAAIEGGKGGKDLWYSTYADGQWKEPVNMGSEINTKGDEITPFIYGNTLFFSSDGQPDNYGGFDIYSTQLGVSHVTVSNLKMPYNSYADDLALVVDAKNSNGFLVSNRDTSLLDDKIYSFSHMPNFTYCKGFISDNAGHYLENVDINLTDVETGKTVYMTKSGKNGKYGLFMDNRRDYVLELAKENYFPLKIECKATQSDSNVTTLENSTKLENLLLDGFELNKAYKMNGLFHQTADVEVLNTLRLSSVITFLRDNPNLVLYVHLFGYLSTEDDFNEILNKKRLENLTNYLMHSGISTDRVRGESYENQVPVNFPEVDPKMDNTYALYFVICKKNDRTFLPKTKEHKR